jgi:hypothetical protein
MWDLIIRAKRASSMLPVLETVLAAFGARRPVRPTQLAATEPTTLLERSESSADIA